LALLVVFAGGAIAWMQRETLLARYYVWQLARASDEERDVWVRRTAGLESAALPGLFACLTREDARACTNARQALACLLNQWGVADPRSAQLLNRLAENLPSQSAAGQVESVELEALLLRPAKSGPVPAAVVFAAAHLTEQAAQSSDRTLHKRSLALVERLLALNKGPEVVGACRQLVQACLRDGQTANEIQAIRLALRPEINCVEQVVPLLNDPAADVRQTAMLAVGDAPAAIATDDLLQWLHDPDPGVRRLCEEALLWSRHLPPEHLKLGRLLTDGRAEVRLQVLDCLRCETDLEPGIWLRRLSHDPSPAVRAAAARVAAADGIASFNDRLEQMAESDPSPTVRQLARHYRTHLASASATGRP
jgi:hypothetical protein